MRWLMPQTQNNPADGGSSNSPSAIPSFAERPLAVNPDVQYNQIPQAIAPIWPTNIPLDITIYVSPSLVTPSLTKMSKDSLVVEEKGFVLGDWKDKRDVDTVFPVPRQVQQNGTLWAHFFIGQSGSQLDPTAPDYDTSKAYHFIRPFTQYLTKKRVSKTRNLLAGSNVTATEEDEEEDTTSNGPTVASYYHPNFTLSFIPDNGIQNYPSMHPALRQFVQLERTGARDASGQNGWYYPILYVNTFWQLREHMTEVNSSVTDLPLHIHLKNTPNWQFAVMASIDEGQKMNREKASRGEPVGPGGDGAEFEEFKRILLDSNPYLLATTGVVTILHMIFEMLAFKSDVSHWRKKKDNVGTSFRTIIANVIMQVIIFLYLLDNNENTSWMILVSSGMGIAIEAWKITKTVNVRVRPTPQTVEERERVGLGEWIKYWPFPYFVAFEDKHKLSETEKKTQEYDEIAFRYLYWVAIPLLLAYAIYSLVYETHKSWYSFIITTLVGSVYAYGFLMMVPSLYINYRLKSVAHMPAKTMMYKFLNTFIDDLFAFTVKMPLLHRLATLRDDVIFFVYLYQKWKYKVDYSRVNEFGQGGDDEEEDEGKKEVNPESVNEGKAKAIQDGKTKASGVENKKQAIKRK
jgi:hypothetical protein